MPEIRSVRNINRIKYYTLCHLIKLEIYVARSESLREKFVRGYED